MRAAFTRPRLRVVRPEPAGGWAIATLVGATLLVVIVGLGAALSGRSPSPITWYLARASGLTLYLLLWLSTVLGLGLTTTLLDRFGGRGLIFSLHGFATAVAYGFLALHLLSLAADRAVPFGPAALLVPFVSPWREPWTGFGVLAGELLVAIGASFGLRRITGYRFWRALHWLAFPLFGLGLAHGIGAGTDRGTIWAQTIYLVTGLAVVWLTGYRILRGPARIQPPRVPGRPVLDRLQT
jgi:predicted ferric reductase